MPEAEKDRSKGAVDNVVGGLTLIPDDQHTVGIHPDLETFDLEALFAPWVKLGVRPLLPTLASAFALRDGGSNSICSASDKRLANSMIAPVSTSSSAFALGL